MKDYLLVGGAIVSGSFQCFDQQYLYSALEKYPKRKKEITQEKLKKENFKAGLAWNSIWIEIRASEKKKNTFQKININNLKKRKKLENWVSKIESEIEIIDKNFELIPDVYEKHPELSKEKDSVKNVSYQLNEWLIDWDKVTIQKGIFDERCLFVW